MQGLFSFLGLGTAVVHPTPTPTGAHSPTITWSMKLVNETASDADLANIQALGISVVGGEWGIDDAEPAQVLALLDHVQAHGMKMIINFSDGSAWGYKEDGTDPANQPPVWQSEKVKNYMLALKQHPAIYGYDISNEAGENLPHGDTFRISLDQLRQASQDVKSIDPSRPIIMRMHYWDEYDGDFTEKNPFAANIVNIVMLNMYSNYTQDGHTATTPNMIKDSGQLLVNKIQAVDPKVKIWLALAAFREDPQFLTPPADDLRRDITAALAIKNVDNIGFFGWGPERYPAEGPGWYLPRDGASLLETIKSFTK